MSSRNSASTQLRLALVLFAFRSLQAPSFADSSHVRIIRLSLRPGRCAFRARRQRRSSWPARTSPGKTRSSICPIRQGYVLATDNGRAEVEFENGSHGFSGDDTVLEFYDLSLEDGAKTTRLILRQGTASFYVNPANGDYFSVTGGDFSVEADGRATFRLDNFDDGSTVNVIKGHVSVLRKKRATDLAKGQSLSMRAGDPTSVTIGQFTDDGDFDRWVSGRIESRRNRHQCRAAVRQLGGLHLRPGQLLHLRRVVSVRGVSEIAGDPTASAQAGRPSTAASGSPILRSACLSLAISRGAGCPITMAAGFAIRSMAGSGLPALGGVLVRRLCPCGPR